MKKGYLKSSGLGLLLGLSLSFNVAWGQTTEVPPNIQVSLVMKATPYCRTLPQKLHGSSFVVGIAYQEKNRISLNAMEALKAEFMKVTGATKVEVLPVKVGDDGRIPAAALGSISALFLTPMRGADIPFILAETARHDVWSIAVDPADCRKGATMSFELVDSRPKFLINMKSAEAENCDFSSQLLKLARTI